MKIKEANSMYCVQYAFAQILSFYFMVCNALSEIVNKPNVQNINTCIF